MNPNARCPFCGVAVFFYANAAGSRVYFDDLGPPWPKHPCTDNPRRSILSNAGQTDRPTRRSKGEVKELLSAASTAGLSRVRTFGQRHDGEWTLVVILAVDRHGQENQVECEFLDSETHEAFRFTCHSEAPLFEVGQFISVNGSQISCIDPESLRPVVFAAGSWVKPAHAQSAEKLALAPLPNPKPANKSKQAKLIRKEQKNINGSKHDMSEAEMMHFNSKKVTIADLFGKLEPVVKAYAREGTRKPRDVAVRLNANGYKTASGSKWTPRLAHFLLGLMFNDKPTPATSGIAHGGTRQRANPKRNAAPSATSGNMSADEIASRLSRLGKIIRSAPDG
ncbi:hypothetical protein [Rhizobium leguminosarum]